MDIRLILLGYLCAGSDTLENLQNAVTNPLQNYGFPQSNERTRRGGNRYATKVYTPFFNGVTGNDSCMDIDVDYVGVNLFERETVESSLDCKDLCKHFNKCKYWVYNYEKQICYGKVDNKKVYTKGYLAGANQCLTADCPIFYDQDIPGYDVGHIHVEHISECITLCRERDDCNSFAFWRNNCFFKNITGPIDAIDNYGLALWRECAVRQCDVWYNYRPLGFVIKGLELPNSVACRDSCETSSVCKCWSFGFGICTLHSDEACDRDEWSSTGGYVAALRCKEDNNGEMQWEKMGLLSRYGLVADYRGEDFKDEFKFEFITTDDPTMGYVNYVSADEALELGLLEVQGYDRVLLKSDSTNVVSGRGRDSIRIETRDTWDDGLFVWAVRHQPHGCGNWPALWTMGPDWPNAGEIDVMEGSNNQSHNHIALHTSNTCNQYDNHNTFDGVWKRDLGTPPYEESRNCYAYSTPHNTGCAVISNEQTFGASLNKEGEGYYVMELVPNSHVKVWFFNSIELPVDLEHGAPVPENWTKTPQAHFKFGSNCDGKAHFHDQKIVINNTFCGGYAGNSYLNDGCPNSGVGSQLEQCIDFVKNNPHMFEHSFWDIKYIRVYQLDEGTKNVHHTKTL